MILSGKAFLQGKLLRESDEGLFKRGGTVLEHSSVIVFCLCMYVCMQDHYHFNFKHQNKGGNLIFHFKTKVYSVFGKGNSMGAMGITDEIWLRRIDLI